jgi:hypothetical protein
MLEEITVTLNDKLTQRYNIYLCIHDGVYGNLQIIKNLISIKNKN